ncbi:MAG: hypothetical protein ACPLN0_05980 [Candidatus Hydrothermia bacterium]
MNRTIIILAIFMFICPVFARTKGTKFRFGANSSLIFENGNAYPVIGFTAGYYPVKFLSLEGSGEYVFRNDYKEINAPLTVNFIYPTKYFSPYAGLGVVYHTHLYSDHNDYSFGGRLKFGSNVFNARGSAGSLEISYDLPDFRGSRGRWYITGRFDQNFEIGF